MFELDVNALNRLASTCQTIAAGPQATGPHHGQDASGAVRITTNAAGIVTDISLNRDWRQAIDPRRLSGAVLDAVLAAADERHTARATTATEAAPPVTRPRTPGGPVGIEPSGAAVEEVLDVLDHVVAELNQLNERVHNDDAVRRTSATSVGGHVTVTMNGRYPEDIRLRPNWLSRANNLEIAAELRSAFTAGYHAARQASPFTTAHATARLRTMLNDPDEFVGRLFGFHR